MPWMIVSNLSIVVDTVHQQIHFCIAFLHFFQRANRPDRSSATSEHEPRLYSRRGTGWLAVSLKLGVIESVVGFAGFAYAPSLTRRYLRTVGRTVMLAGVCVRYGAHAHIPASGHDRGMFIDIPFYSARTSIEMMLKDLPQWGRERGETTPAQDGPGPSCDDLRATTSRVPSPWLWRRWPRTLAVRRWPGHSTASTPNPHVTVHFDAEKTLRLEMRFDDFAVPMPQLCNSAMSSNLAEYTGFAPTVPVIQAPPAARRRANTVTTITGEQDGFFQDIGRLVTQLPRTPTERKIPTRSQTLTAAMTPPAHTRRRPRSPLQVSTSRGSCRSARRPSSLCLRRFRLRRHGRVRCRCSAPGCGRAVPCCPSSPPRPLGPSTPAA